MEPEILLVGLYSFPRSQLLCHDTDSNESEHVTQSQERNQQITQIKEWEDHWWCLHFLVCRGTLSWSQHIHPNLDVVSQQITADMISDTTDECESCSQFSFLYHTSGREWFGSSPACALWCDGLTCVCVSIWGALINVHVSAPPAGSHPQLLYLREAEGNRFCSCFFHQSRLSTKLTLIKQLKKWLEGQGAQQQSLGEWAKSAWWCKAQGPVCLTVSYD